MTRIAEERLGQKLMLAFKGTSPPQRILDWIKERNPAGFTLFRSANIENLEQIRALTGALQNAAQQAGRERLIIATDQEGGQLIAMGEASTQFPGNMALGAARDVNLARRVGYAIGLELAATGVNVNYAPVCDVNTNPDNPNVGVRAFGDDPELVATMGKDLIAGMQSAGIAATAKHFPGNGESNIDPHFGIPVLPLEQERLDEVEFRPFREAIKAGVRMMMTAHVGLPALTGRTDLPATLSREIMHDLLREEMGFEGLLITDALDMEAITQGTGQIIDIIAAIRAGVDLLLLTDDRTVQERIFTGLQLAYARGLINRVQIDTSWERILALKMWLAAQEKPQLNIVGCTEHRHLAAAVARRALTLVRDGADLLPIKLQPGERMAIIMPRPADLTPADTSSYVTPELAQSIQAYHPHVDEIIIPQRPSDSEISSLREKATQYKLLIIGTISAHLQLEQATMVNQLLATGIPTITLSMRTPYDLTVYPQAKTHICTYGIQAVVMNALAAAMWGTIPFRGRLPVQLPGLYDFGHGLES